MGQTREAREKEREVAEQNVIKMQRRKYLSTYPAEYSSSRMDSLEDTHVNIMLAKMADMLPLELLPPPLCASGIRARAIELNSSCVLSSIWSSILISAA